MNYGQLAYLKAEETEKYVRGIMQSENRGAAACSLRPDLALENGYETLLYGNGCVGLNVKIAVTAPSGAENIKVWLYCGDKNVDYVSVKMQSGESREYTFLCCVYTSSGGEIIGVKAEEGGLILNEFGLLAIGGAVSFSRGTACKCDCAGGNVYLAREEDGEIVLSGFSKGKKANVAHGAVFDLSAYDGGVDVLCRDDNGNLWGVCFDSDLNETARVFIDGQAEKLALGRNADGLFMAALAGGEVLLAECGESFSGMSEWTPADFGVGFDDVFFCRQTPNKILFLQKGNRLYAKFSLPEFGMKDCISVFPELIVY